ncbi:MAG: hypothetical protein U0231_19780 [Nitrospiraceae bacterium]
MEPDPADLATFRRRVSSARSSNEAAWESSRRLIVTDALPATLDALTRAVQSSPISESLKPKLLDALQRHHQSQPSSRSETLKELTGLPPSKALRALCVLFGIRGAIAPKWPTPEITPQAVETFVRSHNNPFDLLLETTPASLLELGAGDLSFAEQLVEQYVPALREHDRTLILHSLDRLNPDSRLGGPLHANPIRLRTIRENPSVQFSFHGNQDMFALQALDQTERLAARYAIVTCWAPATPTFAYEPTRLSSDIIDTELRRTKGHSRQIRHEKEAALEVLHGGRSLVFPPWKFEIRGPLALLELMANRGALCILGAVDSQVFWEILSQLIESPDVRPPDVALNPELIPSLFGEIYQRLSELKEGDRCSLADLTPLRREMPRVLPTQAVATSPFRFRMVEIRRGARFDLIPASSTAEKFRDMAEESSPWFLTLVPESTPVSD